MKFTTKLPADCICQTALLRFSIQFLKWAITACNVISAKLPACQSRRLIHLYENCRPTVYLTLSPGKGRSMHIHLTASGKKLIQEKLLPLIQIENDTLASFSPEECEQLLRLNAKYNQTLRSRLSKLEEDL